MQLTCFLSFWRSGIVYVSLSVNVQSQPNFWIEIWWNQWSLQRIGQSNTGFTVNYNWDASANLHCWMVTLTSIENRIIQVRLLSSGNFCHSISSSLLGQRIKPLSSSQDILRRDWERDPSQNLVSVRLPDPSIMATPHPTWKRAGKMTGILLEAQLWLITISKHDSQFTHGHYGLHEVFVPTSWKRYHFQALSLLCHHQTWTA